MPSKTDDTPNTSWRDDTSAMRAVSSAVARHAARDAKRGAKGLWADWRRAPAHHAATALTTILILAVFVLAQSARASVPASADIGPPALTRAAEMRATAVAVDTPEPTPGAQTGAVPADLLPAVARWWPQIVKAATAHGIPPRLFACLVQQESGGSPTIGSPAGAVGLAQLMPATAADLGVTDRTDPAQSLDGGARYLAQQYKAFGTWELALRAYNSGPGAVQRGVYPAETRAYVATILPCFERGA